MKGFKVVPVLRGFTEIAKLFEAVNSRGGVICGGYVRFCASPKAKPVTAGDVDIYCKDDLIFDNLKKHFEEMKLEVRHESDVALTYKKPESGDYAYSPAIQLIKPIKEGAIVASGDIDDILVNFDFTVIRCALMSPSEVMADEDFLEDEKHGVLVLKNIHCPVSSTLRCMKYSRKGYFLKPFEALKLFIDWDKRTPEYRQKLMGFLMKSKEGTELSEEQVDELEAMMRID